MTREEAAKKLKDFDSIITLSDEAHKALNMGIFALERPDVVEALEELRNRIIAMRSDPLFGYADNFVVIGAVLEIIGFRIEENKES